MKIFKKIDVTVQLLLILAASIVNLLFQRDFLSEYLMVSYFIVGGWQILSVIVHALNPLPFRSRWRRVYLWTLLSIVILGLFCIPVFLYYLFFLLFVSAALAIFYFITCVRETQRLAAYDPVEAEMQRFEEPA
jgi:hypothetical protein